MKAKHFAGLDGLRFISITFVVLHHLFTFKTNFGLGRFDYPVLGLIGLYGIHFFFMGSGFLITYLLLSERAAYGRISLMHFFLRRVLRIWPGYYLLIGLALLLLLRTSFFHIAGITDAYLGHQPARSNAFFFAFLPHLQSFFGPTAPYVHHTYTIGIEEQFYVVWGLLAAFFHRWMYAFFIGVLIAYPLLNLLHSQLSDSASTQGFLAYVKSAITYLRYSRFSTFAIGSLFGWAYFHQHRWINAFKAKGAQLMVYAIVIASIATGLSLPYIQNEYMAVLMACVMLIGTFHQESIINYNAGWLTYLGRISYGIYLFHIIAIVLAAKLTVALFGVEETVPALLFIIVVTMGLSILFGHLSYYYFETFFLKLKRRFRRVETGHA